MPALAQVKIINCAELKIFPDNLPDNLVVSGDGARRMPIFKRVQEKVQSMITPDSCAKNRVQENSLSTHVSKGYKQLYKRSCGAASLLFVARDLSLKKLPFLAEAVTSFPVLDESCPVLDDKFNLRFFYEEDIYRITSDYKDTSLGIDFARGSSPHNIIKAAKLLGLEANLYIPINDYTDSLKSDTTMPDVQSGLIQERITINEHAAPSLKVDQLEMKLFSYVDSQGKRIPGSWDETNHWVVLRPDGSVMDPASGQFFDNLNSLITAYNKTGAAVDSGMSIVLNRDRSILNCSTQY
jgi:hypothetical protein